MSGNSPRSWSRDEVASIVTSEIVSLPEDRLAALSPFVEALESFTTDSGPGADGQSYWLIARHGGRVLYWDGVEEQFATGELNGRALSDVRLWGDKLEPCIQDFTT
ncbi:MAG TPA: hypothetical protein VFC25_18415 [Verrucomicrobiae bacterium]|nr:hypothetical protein [Verrucomicrobiae bacterium]